MIILSDGWVARFWEVFAAKVQDVLEPIDVGAFEPTRNGVYASGDIDNLMENSKVSYLEDHEGIRIVPLSRSYRRLAPLNPKLLARNQSGGQRTRHVAPCKSN